MNALAHTAYTTILGLPLVFWIGTLSYVLLAITVGLMVFLKRGPKRLKWHRWLGAITFILATFHMLLGVSAYFG